MRKNDPRQRLMSVFLQELQEGASDIERHLIELERAPAPAEQAASVRSLMRAAHSLKGAAGLVKLASLERVCHAMEDLLTAVRDGTAELDRPAVQLLLRANDALRESGRRLAGGAAPDDALLDAIRSELAAGSADAPDAAPPLPARRPSEAASADKIGDAVTAPGAAAEPTEEAAASQVYARIPAAKLDSMLRQSGELLIARSASRTRLEQLAALQELVRSGSTRAGSSAARRARAAAADGRPLRTRRGARSRDSLDELLAQLGSGLRELAGGLSRDRRAMDQAAHSLDLEVRRARLQPFASACEGLDRLVRDLAVASGKEAALEIVGRDAEIDRSVAEGLQDVLRHLVRNAVDHGIEAAEERAKTGKPPLGRITISAALAGDRISIRVADDGRGLDVKEIRNRAGQLGPAAGGDSPLEQIFLPGLSTSAAVTTSSGRGVGLDIVKTLVERMRGAVEVSHRPGRGASFTLTVPTSLGTIRALLLRAGEQIVAVDTSSVDRVVRVTAKNLRVTGGRLTALTRSSPAPALDLRDWLGLPAGDAASLARRPAVMLNEIGRGAAILVDAVLAEQEFLIRTIGARLHKLRDFAGGIVLPDGRIALVLNAASLGQVAIRRGLSRPSAPAADAATPRRILIADDSVTTRTLGKTIVEDAGYEVAAVADGDQAWQMVQKGGVDLVLADVDMPGLDGFMLTETIRRSAQFRHLPVILLTAREKAQDRQRGLEAGADAYLVKSAFDQRELLRAIAELI